MGLAHGKVVVESVDYEETILKKMQDDRPEKLKDVLNYQFADCTNLEKDKFKDEGFDLAVDKGTLDAIAVGDDQETVDKC